MPEAGPAEIATPIDLDRSFCNVGPTNARPAPQIPGTRIALRKGASRLSDDAIVVVRAERRGVP
jgi:hypothetical protein